MKKIKLEELGRISIDAFKEAGKLPVTILLDNVRSLHNVGSTFRTADAFRVEKIILTGITGKPPHREIQKTALGATESVHWEHHENGEDAVVHLKDDDYTIVVVEQTTESVSLEAFEVDKKKKYCLVFGNEVNGVSEKILAQAHVAIEIPQIGTKHSLNIAVCLGIVTWEFFKKLSVQ